MDSEVYRQLAEVVAAWSELSETTRISLLEIVRGAKGGPAGDQKHEDAIGRFGRRGRSYLDAVNALIAYQTGGARRSAGGSWRSTSRITRPH